MRRDWGEGGGDGTNKGGGKAGGGLVECLPWVSEGEEDGSASARPQRSSTGGQLLFSGEKENPLQHPRQ